MVQPESLHTAGQPQFFGELQAQKETRLALHTSPFVRQVLRRADSILWSQPPQIPVDEDDVSPPCQPEPVPSQPGTFVKKDFFPPFQPVRTCAISLGCVHSRPCRSGIWTQDETVTGHNESTGLRASSLATSMLQSFSHIAGSTKTSQPEDFRLCDDVDERALGVALASLNQAVSSISSVASASKVQLAATFRDAVLKDCKVSLSACSFENSFWPY